MGKKLVGYDICGVAERGGGLTAFNVFVRLATFISLLCVACASLPGPGDSGLWWWTLFEIILITVVAS